LGGFISVRFQSDIAFVYFRPIPVRQQRCGDVPTTTNVLSPSDLRQVLLTCLSPSDFRPDAQRWRGVGGDRIYFRPISVRPSRWLFLVDFRPGVQGRRGFNYGVGLFPSDFRPASSLFISVRFPSDSTAVAVLRRLPRCYPHPVCVRHPTRVYFRPSSTPTHNGGGCRSRPHLFPSDFRPTQPLFIPARFPPGRTESAGFQ